MTSSGIYKLDNGKPYLNNCFPAKNLLRTPEEGRGHWLVARKCNLKKKPKSVLQAPSDSQEIQKKVSFEVRGKKGSQQENQEDIPGHVLDQAFLLKHHCVRKPSDLCSVNVSGLKFSKAKEKDFKHFHSVIYINASENLLPLEAFHTFPTLKELELAFNGIKTVYVKYGDFKFLEFLDLSFNSLTAEAICDLGILPHLRVLLLTGNGLTSLPPNLAVTEQEASVTSLTRRRYILRFPALETLMLDDNKLSSPNCFASLAGLRRLKKLSLDQNRIFRIPYLQQFQLRDGSGDWVGGKGNPHKEPQSMRQPKSCIFEASDEQPDYTVLPMKKDVDRTEVVFSSYPGFSTSEATKVRAFPPIFEILPVKSLKIRNQTLAPPFPELRYLSLAYNKVKTQVPKVPKQPLILHHPPVTIVKSSSKEMLESDAGPTKEPLAARSSPLEQMPVEGLEGLSLSHRTFVPLPPICSDSTVHSEETTSQENDRPSHLSPDQPSDEDTKSMESIFLTQVNELPPSILPRDDSAMKKEGQRPPHTAPREVKRAWRKLPTASLSSKYHGYEELLTAKPDPAFIEPKGIQKNTQALQHMLKYPLLCRSSKPRLDKLQKHYVPKEKRAQRIPVPPPRKTRAQLLDDILIRMRDPRNITEAPLGAVLRQRTEQRLMNQKQYLEAKRLLKEFRARYRQLVHCSLRTMFRAAAPPPGRPALREGQPRFSRFLQFMDEFCQEPTASDSKG
ncbi:X-ray radiation resistance-associated protein 1 isoform X3 [Canis lupus baileyi]|uniref:X-ray radiation resistance-associated protein 1 isoform X2 n=1 Tax=Canis lupus familiaris TaxID=9615 RepID=UPI0006B3D5CA|nr:X-ray radiation resistance-associated protein 1 isoform X2 [Canis lupus familiaris]XP_038286013.1 X-ray radiation resistance-associated protein 1 isoform X2 [Canis lupus familiaris]XP_038424551.1 X-ray radiation resistance-associated protein 1 isoform X2 [Canis lupus familiaris]|eukprot:XP_013978034.1 X-ray radiation resistance-associated protein 1 isoform X3 [Canis lupus familiaris]